MNASLIEQLTSPVRKKCVECRARAMMGSAQAALTALDEMMAITNLPELDHVCIALLKAEILATEDHEDQALEVFRQHIDPKLDRLSPEHALIIEDNRNTISTFLERTSGRDFYLTVDARRIAKVELWESSPLLDAAEAAAEGDHHEALPLVWGECLRAYRTGSWRSQIVNTRHLARECLLLGAVDEAALQAMIGEDEKLGEKVSNELLSRGDRELIEKTVGKLVRFGNLSKHARIASQIFARMVDVTSRKYLPVLDRLAVVYRMPVNFYQHSNVMPRVFAGSIRTAMHLIMITAKAFSQRILITGPPGPEVSLLLGRF